MSCLRCLHISRLFFSKAISPLCKRVVAKLLSGAAYHFKCLFFWQWNRSATDCKESTKRTEIEAASQWTENIAGHCFTGGDNANLCMDNNEKSGLPIMSPSSPCILLYLPMRAVCSSVHLCAAQTQSLLRKASTSFWTFPLNQCDGGGGGNKQACILWQLRTHTCSQSDAAPLNMLLCISVDV